ncbi:LasR-specific antiactivator QslA [Pseudomonas sp. RIT-PI-AD]|uniref:LasR-specific antiactivator QslA n=1 Tax=Pseudomonas sp. RIT-PI-AD TaxID=3035294 RepID=UPI0021D9B2FC|nr:LasR-specific antiactivator QslA [Pseudomonas sp. RIT-PI-AD]
MRRAVRCQLPGHDDQPGAEIDLPVKCQSSFTQGVACANAWLDDRNAGWLWAGLIAERDCLPRAIQRRAFEIGFLSRVHQRLCSPRGGGHLTRRVRDP